MNEDKNHSINSQESSIIAESTFSISQSSSLNKYLVLLFICLVSLANGLQSNIIPNEFRRDFSKVYHLTEHQLNLFNYIYPIFYIIAVFFSISLIENLQKFRFINSLTLASILTIFGCFLRTFINTHIYICYLGQILCGLATPFILNTPLKISTFLFEPAKRIFTITSILISHSIGILLSQTLPKLFVQEEFKLSFETIVLNYFKLYFYLSLICIPALFITWIIRPSMVVFLPNGNIYKEKKRVLRNDIKDLLKNANFMYLVLSFTFVYGFFSAYTSKVEQVFQMYGVKSIEGIEIWATIAGICTSIIIAFIINRNKRIKCLLITLVIISICYFSLVIALIIAVKYYSKTINLFVFVSLYFIYNMSLSPIYSLCNYLVFEMTYPFYSSISLGLMACLSTTLRLLTTLVLDSDHDGVFAHSLGIGLVIVSFVMLIIMKEKNIFRKHEKGIELVN